MTTVAFTPNNTASPPFSTIVTLDNAAYSLQVRWSAYRRYWYMSITDAFGNLIINQPLIGSPPTSNIYLAPGVFKTSTLLYRVNTGNFEIGP